MTDLASNLKALADHDTERAKIVRAIENLQLGALQKVIAAFDTPANRKAIEAVQALVPELTDGRQGQANQLGQGLSYALDYLKGEAARIEAQIAAEPAAN